ncbi:MAG: hypothetical protein HPY69_11840 [Armatimonadetes bacterium]|nr:hypothetical protein [Armatimonadota bacterium]
MHGRPLALEALAGQATSQPPVALFTWGFDYTWQVAGLAPWQLALGSQETWHQAYLALHLRHRPDLLFYEGAGSGPNEAELLADERDRWVIRDGNTGHEYEMDKQSLALRGRDSGAKVCDPLGPIQSREDARRLIPDPASWGDSYLGGLTRLISELGDRCLVLPHDSPGYIKACYAFGFEAAMMAMLYEPDLFTYACDRYAAGDELHMRELAQAGAEAVFIADSWASADILSPAMIERFALPYQASITAAAHAAGLRVIMWNEGDLGPILPQEAAIPFDAFAFEQPRKGFSLSVAQVREVFGPQRCLFGNLDSEELLLRGSRTAIQHAVREQISQSGEGNPFVLCFGSPLPSNVDPATVDLVIAAARDTCGL